MSIELEMAQQHAIITIGCTVLSSEHLIGAVASRADHGGLHYPKSVTSQLFDLLIVFQAGHY
jgi:hypothetical protein